LAQAQADQARAAGRQGIQVLCRSSLSLGGEPALAGPFDAIVCVDAAYHLSPRADWLADAWQRLRPGGRLAYCDLSLQAGASPWLRAAARLCGVPTADLLPLAQQVQRLQALGFQAVQADVLDAPVLGGFADFVRRQAAAQHLRPWQAGWRAVATTAALIPPCRAAGLGYALLSATRPAAPPTTAPAARAGG
jgi:SAM-dependent methyltransferase